MSDGTTINSGSGGDIIMTEQVGGTGVKYPVTKIYTGGLDVNGGPVTGSNPFDVRIGDASNPASVFPAGFLRTSDEPHQTFYDPFDTALDTTNRWHIASASGGGGAATVLTGVLALGTGTTTLGYSYLQSQPTFAPTVPSWLGNSWAIKIESPVVINGCRGWGCGTSPVTPTVAVPLTDGYAFEIDTAGKLNAVIYAAGVRTVIQDMSAATGNSKQPTDAAYHRYIIFYRTDKVYWYIDSLTNLVATSNFQSPNIQTLPVKSYAVAAATPPTTSLFVTCTGMAVWDTGKNASSIADGTYGWRKITVKPASTAATGTDTALVTAQSPNRAEMVGTAAALGALNATVQINAAGYGAVGAFIAAGTLVGTIVAEASYDGGTTWVGATFDNPVTGLKTATLAFASSNPATSLSIIGCSGASMYRVRVSLYTSGTATATMRANDIYDPSLLSTAPSGSVAPAVGLQIGGIDPTGSFQFARMSVKGSASFVGLAMQALKDGGRALVSFVTASLTTTATETAVTLVPWRDLSAAAGAASHTITAGKRLRLQTLSLTARSIGSTQVGAVVRFRMQFGAVSVSSPVMATLGVVTAPIVSGSAGFAQSTTYTFPDGFELSGSMALGVTQLCTSTAGQLDIAIHGFEY